MFHFYLFEEQSSLNGESLQNTSKHNVMQQPSWSIKTLLQLFVIKPRQFLQNLSNLKHHTNSNHPTPSLSLPLFPHPNNKYQTSCIKYVKALQFVLKWKMNHKPFKKICTEYSTTELREGFKSPNPVFNLLSCFQLASADLSTKRGKYYT